MHYEGDIIRPPSEIDSILLQVATGCPHNNCTFCGAYQDKTFRIKDDAVIDADILWAAEHLKGMRRLFLCDGDCLALPQHRLVALLQSIRQHLPQVTRVGTYGSAMSIARKTDDELAVLRSLGLSFVYMGVESGDDDVLRRVNKRVSSAQLIEQAARVTAAGMKLNVTVIVGLGGVEGSMRHARETGRVLSAMSPDFIGVLSLMLLPDTPLHGEYKRGEFSMPDACGLLRELRELLACTDIRSGIFLTNHASNHLPMRVRLPKDKDVALEKLDAAIGGYVPIKSEWMRAL
ncbi:radical SAM protein [Desulfovibrio mangrovi]|uniref:radical SAM protein n=1 Tax=Desulfovibrio mangrovi TaxID=2976983 RepID=UPI002247AB21|nr:radical SAM protein [Desulfovibrio mangrovi]UZP68871.1 radical SAM protein [Desulfovibrio mangrovi]